VVSNIKFHNGIPSRQYMTGSAGIPFHTLTRENFIRNMVRSMWQSRFRKIMWVGATGSLQDEEEIHWLDSLAAVSEKKISTEKETTSTDLFPARTRENPPFPPSSPLKKTLHYKAKPCALILHGSPTNDIT
jgi:hypothetical protein